MWLFTKDGFFSAVQHRTRTDTIIVRARVREDLKRFVERTALLTPGPKRRIVENAGSDYRFRVFVTREEWMVYCSWAARTIDYDNFKDAVADARREPRRNHVMHEVWSVVATLQTRPLRRRRTQELYFPPFDMDLGKT